MSETRTFSSGGFRYVPGPFQYSGGVAAEPGFTMERVQLAKPVPLAAGFAIVEDYLTAVDRPFTSFCACELRSPAPFTEQGFTAFNRIYVGTLERWGLFRNDDNPVARSNVCPVIDPPPEPSLYAFSFTRPAPAGQNGPNFVVAGSAEAAEGYASYSERIIRIGDTSPDAMEEKARYVMGAMERRMEALGAGWSDVTVTQAYTVHDLYPFLASGIVSRGAARQGLVWHYARPPVQDLEFEMDVRSIATERVLQP